MNIIQTSLGILAMLAIAGSAHAATIIGFEAESGTLGSEFDPPIADVAALGSFYITTETNNSGEFPGSDDFTVSYSLNVPAGTYDVYIRGRIGANGANDDSFFYAKEFGDADPTLQADWQKINGISAFGVPNNAFGWSNALTSTVTSPGGSVTWEIGAREDGFDIDAFALVPSGQTVTASELDDAVTAVVPEPVSLAMGLVGLTLIAARRRRR